MPKRPDFAKFLGAIIGLLFVAAVGVEARAGDPVEGRAKAAMCRTCHGVDGLATIPTAPHLAGESHVYLSSQLKAFRSGKREHEIMSVIAKQLSDKDIEDLAAWYSSIEISVTLPE